jgi:hypothetical protein
MVAVTSPISSVIGRTNGAVGLTETTISQPTSAERGSLQWSVALTNTHSSGNLYIVFANPGSTPAAPSTTDFTYKIAPQTTLTIDISNRMSIWAIADAASVTYSISTFAR